MIPPQKWYRPALLLTTLSWFSLNALADVDIKRQEGKLRVEMDGKLFTEYHYKGVSRPFLYPILGPGGARMTRDWPMAETPNEERDHPHHRSLWFAHGEANGVDLWSEGEKAGRTVQKELVEVQGGKKRGVIRTRNEWVAKDGKVIGSDETTITFHQTEAGRFIDYAVTIRPVGGESLVLGDTKEGTMAIRLAETMRLKGKVGKGHIVNSEGVRDGETWGKRAKWVDYFGPVDEKTVGVAMFDHPSNPRHPTWWHVRDYGLFAANPFGLHDFEKKPPGAGNFTIEKGGTATFHYRFYFHDGDVLQAKVAEEYTRFSNESAHAIQK